MSTVFHDRDRLHEALLQSRSIPLGDWDLRIIGRRGRQRLRIRLRRNIDEHDFGSERPRLRAAVEELVGSLGLTTPVVVGWEPPEPIEVLKRHARQHLYYGEIPEPLRSQLIERGVDPTTLVPDIDGDPPERNRAKPSSERRGPHFRALKRRLTAETGP